MTEQRNVSCARRGAGLSRSAAHPDRTVLITGGAGFVGSNLADRLLGSGSAVTLFDNLSRRGVEANIAWLRENHGDRVRLEIADIRDRAAVRHALRGVSQVYHLAAQVAVTTSFDNPRTDFEINTLGTLNLLEEMRALETAPSLVFTSTNKVYGGLEDLKLRPRETRYEPVDPLLQACGIDESRPLDFQTPYGCSKGAAEQYVIDHARSFSIPAVALRMSCIYGPRQLGTEDQGWVAHFLIRAQRGEPITIYGSGLQVRDCLFIDDLVEALVLAQSRCRTLSGQAFNLGGGPANTTSLLELIDLIAALRGQRPQIRFDRRRPGDQNYYVSNIRKFQSATGWMPRIALREGIEALEDWLLTFSPAAARGRNRQLQNVAH